MRGSGPINDPLRCFADGRHCKKQKSGLSCNGDRWPMLVEPLADSPANFGGGASLVD